MQTGELDKLIEVFSGADANNSGEVTRTYTSLGNVWAEIISQRGAESFVAARTDARETIRVRIRNIPFVGTLGKIVWDGKTYNIKYVDRTQVRQGYLWFTAESKDV